MSLKLGASGVRGTYIELTPQTAAALSEAFSTYVDSGPIAVATDTRPSANYLKYAVVSGLIATGARIDDYDVLPTPILQWLIRHRGYAGGVAISGGHASFDRNSLIFLNRMGGYLSPYEIEEFFNLYHSKVYARKRFDHLGATESIDLLDARLDAYFEALISGRRGEPKSFRFAIDCSNGATGRVLARLSASLGIDFIPLFCDEQVVSVREPEPNRSNADILSTVVRETGCDGGFLLNSDASRVLVVDETGRVLSEELTFPIFSRIVLESETTNVVTTYSTSKTIDHIARKYGGRVFRTDVGPSSVVQTLLETKAAIGGEGSGSVVYIPFSHGYDAFVFMQKLIDFLRMESTTVAQLAGEFTEPQIHKTAIPLAANEVYASLEKIERLYSNTTRLKDGFYIEEGDDWLCIRASSTRAMIRVVGEGKTVFREIENVKESLR
jgi:phosphomannomutase